LHAQLQGDAALVIGSFPLCDNNYAHCVALLKETFGQQHKLVDAHMEAILHVSTPSNNLSSLQNFFDTMQNHIRALAALGTPPETYGPMLIAVILPLLCKLPSDVKSRMARDHYDSEWTPNTLLDSILKEISIMKLVNTQGSSQSLEQAP